jgi:hypothetical protein
MRLRVHLASSVFSCILLFFSGPASAAILDILLAPRPQAPTNTCQSYALALAIGSLAGSPLPVSTVDELRASEFEIRKRIETIAAARVGAIADPAEPRAAIRRESLNHGVWQQAVREDTYDGHIVTVYGVSTANPVALRGARAAVAQSGDQASSAPADLKVCDQAGPSPAYPATPGDQRYFAQVWLESSYRLKVFGQDLYKVMWVAPTPKREGEKARALRKDLLVAQFVEGAIVDPDAAVTAAKAFVGMKPQQPLAAVDPPTTGPSAARVSLGVGPSGVEQAALDVLFKVATVDVMSGEPGAQAEVARRSALRAGADSLRGLAGAAFETINHPVGAAGVERRDRLAAAREGLDPTPPPR